MEFKLINNTRVVLAETPIWDPRINRLYWTDLFKGTVYRYDPLTGIEERVETGSFIGSAIPCDAVGKLLVAVDDGMMLLDYDTGKMELVAVPQPNTGEFRYNDTRCDAAGRIFTSSVSKSYAEPHFDPDTMAGKLYMVNKDGSVVTLVDKLAQFNTIFFDRKDENLFVIDTYNKQLLRFDYSIQGGPSGEPEVVIIFDDMPDGATVDSEDNVYVFHWSEKKHITVWSLNDYSFVKSIPFPVKHICCGGFGGQDMKDLYVATSKFWLPVGDEDYDAGAGGIFITRLDVAGLKQHFYQLL